MNPLAKMSADEIMEFIGDIAADLRELDRGTDANLLDEARTFVAQGSEWLGQMASVADTIRQSGDLSGDVARRLSVLVDFARNRGAYDFSSF